MKIASCLSTVVTFLLLIDISKAKKRAPKCSLCKEVTKNFQKGMERTMKSNFGGGNTDWEESRLGSYADSEIRLVEIMENICQDASKECHHLVEENEEIIEDFWFKSGLQKSEESFFEFFCINMVKACCPKNSYGPTCKECTGGIERPCRGNGRCDGEGTREGSGKCKCSAGYKGKTCDECSDGYFEEVKNDTDTICKVCHISCKNKCNAYGRQGCEECKDGWTYNKDLGCQDIDECFSEPCEKNQYCANTQGSYECLNCNDACNGCSGSGPENCNQCSEGFFLNGTLCIDVDECKSMAADLLCAKDNEMCQNTLGSYKCVCSPGFQMQGDGCQHKPTEAEQDQKEAEEDTNRATPDEVTEQKEEL
ncbi:cysteine-rich with EGF-like domain protein 2-B isoform X2 [Pomacea canaliculata]|uniref:cysteine-rich with EGF-like domain protein 2-B isoform X2 n=1 Tax=Pomacea canaliculata TaxID=400727 RepID=UPI000D73BB17|nr:cysteine-rich with EGF-like domain protein 2-B isoform X2 [Pomacea canaliculata]